MMARSKQIIVDADGSPVKEIAIHLATTYQWSVVIVSSYDHFTNHPHKDVRYLYVDAGRDAADFRIVQEAKFGDLVITQDYGLASLLLNKCDVMHHGGWFYTKENIDPLLIRRYVSQQQRQAGKRVKGAAPFTDSDRDYFFQQLEKYLRKRES